MTTDAHPTLAEAADLGGYDPDGEVDVAGHASALAAYVGTLGAGLAAAAAAGASAPHGYALRDLALGGVAVHKFTRVLTRSSVTSAVRAPFTEFEGAAGSGEHHESPRGHDGVRHTVGELLTCPFCLGVWASTAYVVALAAAPRAARAWAAVFAVTALSDGLQHGYARLRTD